MNHMLSHYRWDDIDIDTVVEHSFRDFHAKGLDYLCLHRSEKLTLKAYFFAEGLDSQEASEVVNPHDHRYNFMTQCFSGLIRNKWYRIPPCSLDAIYRGDYCGKDYEVFEWRTPLLGGDGFTYDGFCPLQEHRHGDYLPGEAYYMLAEELHTIQVMAPETCIVLAQYEDVVPADQPTRTFVLADEGGPEPPPLDGLYNTFTADQAVKRLGLLRELADKL